MQSGNPRPRLRVTWTLVSLALMLIAVFTLSDAPALLVVRASLNVPYSHEGARMLVAGTAMLAAYLLFAFLLMLLSALSTRVVGWRTPAGVTPPIASLDPPLLAGIRAPVILHAVRVLAGSMLRASPLRSLYVRKLGVEATARSTEAPARRARPVRATQIR